MSYTVNKLAKLAGISVRTLHHYDHVGLLKPAKVGAKNRYREYGDAELLRLQQILFFRELDFPLDEIRRVIDTPGFDMRAALRDQRALIEIKKKRLSGLITTIDKTLKKLHDHIPMEDKELYGGLSKEEEQAYAAEAKERWGNTEAYRQSMERTKRFTKADWDRVKEAGVQLAKALAATMSQGPTSDAFQALIAQHYHALRTFYEPNLTMYRGLGDMYVNDPRFTKYYDRFAPGLAACLRDGIHYYADRQEETKKDAA